MRGNVDRNNFEYGQFSRSAKGRCNELRNTKRSYNKILKADFPEKQPFCTMEDELFRKGKGYRIR